MEEVMSEEAAAKEVANQTCTLEDLPGACWPHILPYLNVHKAHLLSNLNKTVKSRFVEQTVLQNAMIPLTMKRTTTITLIYIIANHMKNVYWKDLNLYDLSEGMFEIILASPFLRGITSLVVKNTLKQTNITLDSLQKFFKSSKPVHLWIML